LLLKINKLIEKFQEQVVGKGKEINEYREKYNIRFQGETTSDKTANEKLNKTNDSKSSGILVDK
jgi:hypothetical protein